jgi:hypothetical protein
MARAIRPIVSLPGLAARTQRVNSPPYASAINAARLTRARTVAESPMRVATSRATSLSLPVSGRENARRIVTFGF